MAFQEPGPGPSCSNVREQLICYCPVKKHQGNQLHNPLDRDLSSG